MDRDETRLESMQLGCQMGSMVRGPGNFGPVADRYDAHLLTRLRDG